MKRCLERIRKFQFRLSVLLLVTLICGCNTLIEHRRPIDPLVHLDTNFGSSNYVIKGHHSFEEYSNVQPDAASHVINQNQPNHGRRYWAASPTIGYRAIFEDQCVRFEINETAVSSHAFTMQLTAYGYGNQMFSVAPAETSYDDNRIIYKRGVIEEWYVQTPKGTEQGFTLAAAPGLQGREELVLKLSLSGELEPRLSEDNSNIGLYDGQGNRLMTFSKLIAMDASGALLPSRMETQSMDGPKKEILLVVDDTDAIYPIIVDPILTTPKLIATDGTEGDFFGECVSLYKDVLAVGANAADLNGSKSGAVYIYGRNQDGANQWGLLSILLPDDGAPDDRFGASVAVYEDTIVVGAYNDDDNGAVYVFAIENGGADNWRQVAKLSADDGAENDSFGTAVAVYEGTIVVGAYNDDDKGSAYIFHRNQDGTGEWTQAAKLVADDGAAGDIFGYSVALSGDNAVVGAYFGDTENGENAGSVYVFNRDHGGKNQWGQVAKLIAADGSMNDWFGSSVAISVDTLAVGASYDEIGPDSWANNGTVYIFERDRGGENNWGQVKKLYATDGGNSDLFGRSVALYGDLLAGNAGQSLNCDLRSRYLRLKLLSTDNLSVVAFTHRLTEE